MGGWIKLFHASGGQKKARVAILIRENETRGQLRKSTNTWMLSKTLLNHQWVTEEIKDDIKKKCLKVNENMLIQNL